MLKINIPEIGQKAHPSLFCLFVRDLTLVAHMEYPWSQYYKSTLRFLLSKYLLQVTTLSTFQNTHIYSSTGHRMQSKWKAYRQPDHNTHLYPCYQYNSTCYKTLKCHRDIIFICLYFNNRLTDKTFFITFGTKQVPIYNPC